MTETIDLTPQELDLVLYGGAGVRFRLVVTDKDQNPVNLTGTIEAQIRTRRGVIGDPQGEFDIDLTDASTGIAILSLTGEHTQTLAETKKFTGYWDVKWTPEGAEPRVFCQGHIEVDVNVSR